jgi:hypothetical protein
MSAPAPATTARRLRRITCGVSLIAIPALLVVQAPIDPAEGGTGEVMLRAATEHRTALTVSALLLLVSGMLMAPAAVAILHQARDRGAVLANAGAVLAVLGGFGHAGIAMFYLFALPLPGGDPAEMVSYVDRLNETAAVGAVAFPLIMCFGLGILVLGWAAWRAGTVGLWAPGVVTIAVLAELVLPFSSNAVAIPALIAVTVVFGTIGVRVLRMSDTEWDGVRISPARSPVNA